MGNCNSTKLIDKLIDEELPMCDDLETFIDKQSKTYSTFLIALFEQLLSKGLFNKSDFDEVMKKVKRYHNPKDYEIKKD